MPHTIPEAFIERLAQRYLNEGKHNEADALRSAISSWRNEVRREAQSFAETIERKARAAREAQAQAKLERELKSRAPNQLEDLA